MQNIMKTHEKLRSLRQTKGYSLEKAAGLSGYSKWTIINWESGKRSPKISDLEAYLDKGFGCSLNELLHLTTSIKTTHIEDASGILQHFNSVLSDVLGIASSIDESRESVAMAKDLMNGEANEEATQVFVRQLGPGVVKMVRFLKSLRNTPEAIESLETIRTELDLIDIEQKRAG